MGEPFTAGWLGECKILMPTPCVLATEVGEDVCSTMASKGIPNADVVTNLSRRKWLVENGAPTIMLEYRSNLLVRLKFRLVKESNSFGDG
ncbi:MAG: hypothetical protein CMI26_07110 [Opitutae bacterium]|nr:hypothetical protein [Opitutae bacterium]